MLFANTVFNIIVVQFLQFRFSFNPGFRLCLITTPLPGYNAQGDLMWIVVTWYILCFDSHSIKLHAIPPQSAQQICIRVLFNHCLILGRCYHIQTFSGKVGCAVGSHFLKKHHHYIFLLLIHHKLIKKYLLTFGVSPWWLSGGISADSFTYIQAHIIIFMES